MKPETNLLRRVYLNGDPGRLPKEEREYMVHFKGTEDPLKLYVELYEPQHESVSISWMQNIDWYLSPIPREEIIEKVEKAHDKWLFDDIESIKELGEFVADEIIGGK